jgi:alginate O-acetyltransferase complex protein AlgJ
MPDVTEAPPHTRLPPIHEAWLPREHSLHRPRHGGRQRLALICAAIFFATPLVGLIGGIDPPQIENRTLTRFPALSQGWQFLANLGPWATDHLIFRGDAIRFADWISRGVFDEPPALGTNRDSSPTGPITFNVPKESNNITVPQVIEGKNGWMYLGDDVLGRCKQTKSLNDTLIQLRRLRNGVEASGRKFVLIVPPDKTTMVPEFLPDNYVGKDCARKVTDELWRLLDAENFVLDLRPELRAAGQALGKPVYPPLDAHWGDEGGVVMARSLAEALHPGISGSWVISPKETWQTSGDLPPLIGRTGEINGQYYAIRPGGLQDETVPLPADFTHPTHLTTATGPGTVPDKVGLLGDSFTIRALRYLAASFSDITVLHYGKVDQDAGRSAGEMLVWNKVVAVELVERTLASGNSLMVEPAVVDGILSVLSAHPMR